MTRVLWKRMLHAYQEHATIGHIVAKAGVGKKTAKRAIENGFPSLGLPALMAIQPNMAEINRLLAKYRRELDDDPEARGELIRRKAEEALLTKVAVDASTRACLAAAELGEKIMAELKNLKVADITPRHISMLARAVDNATAAAQRTLQMQSRVAGEPNELLSVRLGVLVESCTRDEIQYINEHGQLPARLLGYFGPPNKASSEDDESEDEGDDGGEKDDEDDKDEDDTEPGP